MDKLELTVLAVALEQQTGELVDGIISADRIRQALTTGPVFTPDERRMLWLSPDARETYFTVRERLDRETQDQLYLAGYGKEVRLRAASSTGDVHTIEGSGYVLTVFHDQIGGQDEWSLSLQLDEAFRAQLFTTTAVRLYDSGGLTWIKGVPDQIGQIGTLWERDGETPLERASKYGLLVGI